jgi:predicted ATPase/DNA-binding SARP family transcriptional activator
MRIRLLGPIELETVGADTRPVRGEKQQLLFAVLALEMGTVVASDRLIEVLWGADLPSDPANSLQYQISQARKMLGDTAASPTYLHREGLGYRLGPTGVDTDVDAMRFAVAEARTALDRGDSGSTLELVDRALGLWRGPSLGDLAYTQLGPVANRLESERVAARELRADALLVADRLDEALSELRILTAEHPLREGLWERLVTVLYRLGRQTEALRGVQMARDTLAEVGLEPSEGLAELEQRVIDRDPALAPAAAGRHNFPASANRLVGRDDDLTALVDSLDGHRLVTVVGPGGAGKTRIAVEAGRARAARYAGGGWMVRLDTLDDPGLVAAEIGRVLGMREDYSRAVDETLAAHIADQAMLVVLDNCEHVLESVSEVVEYLVSTCPALTVLATSQVVLGVPAEHVFDLSPLAVPGQTSSIFDPPTGVAAVALFLERARAVGADTDRWTADDLAAVANVVSALDGLPLAIELAAARTRTMPVGEIAQGLEDRFTLFNRGARTAPPRQRSLRGAIEWSLDLLTTDDRALLARWSTFAGGFDAASAAAVGGLREHQARDLIADMVDRSLLCRIDDVAGTARFMMLESIRHYLGEYTDPIDLARARDAHLDRFADVAVRGDAGIRGPEQMAWLARMDVDYENFRAALSWSLGAGSIDRGVQIGAMLGRYWDWRGLLKEAAAWLSRLARVASPPMPLLAWIIGWQTFTAWEVGALEDARRLATRARSVADVSEEPYDRGAALSGAILVARSDGDLATARALGREIAGLAEEARDGWMMAWVESTQATIELAAGDLDTADTHAQRAVDGFTALADRRCTGWGLTSQAHAAHARGETGEAFRLARGALDAAWSTEDQRSVVWLLEFLAELHLHAGDSSRAAVLFGASRPLTAQRGLAGSPSRRAEADQLSGELRELLGPDLEELLATGVEDVASLIAGEIARGTAH